MKNVNGWLTGLLLAGVVAAEAQAPLGFRGDGSGRYPDAVMPAFDIQKGLGLAWRTEVPAGGCSSPVVIGQTVVLTGDPDVVMGFDAGSGKLLWRKDLGIVAEQLDPDTDKALRAAVEEFRTTRINDQGKVVAKVQEILKAKVHRKDWAPGQFGWALPTPVADGRKVYVAFHGGIVAALDANGQIAWRKAFPTARDNRLGPRGFDASPVLVDGILVLSGATGTLGLDAATGEQKYQGPQPPYASTPCVWRKDGRAHLVWANGLVMSASDGKVLQQACLENRTNHVQITDSSPVMAGDRLFVVFGNDHGVGDQKTSAYDLSLRDGAVAMTNAWQGPAYLPGMPEEKQNKRPFTRISPVIFGDWVVTAVPGKRLWAQRITDGSVLTPMPEVVADGSPHVWQPSPIVVGKTLLVPEGLGRLTLLDLVDGKPQVRSAQAIYETPAKGMPSGPRMPSTPAMVGNSLYLRTSKELIALR